MSLDVPNTICCILHVLCADLCISYVQIYACVMCIAVQTGSMRFAGPALLALCPYRVRRYIYIHMFCGCLFGVWRFVPLGVPLEMRRRPIYIYIYTYVYICTDAVRTQSEQSEPSEAQRARLDCISHNTCKNLYVIHAKACT